MLWNLIKADFLKLKHANWLWFFIFGTIILVNVIIFVMFSMNPSLSQDLQFFVFTYSAILSFCFPIGVGILSNFINKVDSDNWALLYTKNHRFRYFVSKVIVLAILSFFSLSLIFVGFRTILIALLQDQGAVFSLWMIFITYFGFLFFLFPVFTALFIFIRGTLMPISIILCLYLFYPFILFMMGFHQNNNTVIQIMKVDKAISSYLPQNQFNKEFITKTFWKDWKILNNDINKDILLNFSKKWEQIKQSLISGNSKSLYVGITYFLIFWTFWYVWMRRREIKT